MAQVGRPKGSNGKVRRMEALYEACQCGQKTGWELVACEVGCLTGPTHEAWRRAHHLAWHKYQLSGQEAFIFAFAFALGLVEGKEGE